MEISTSDLATIAAAAVATLTGGAMGLKRLSASWIRASSDIKAAQGEMGYIERLERENSALRKENGDLQDRLNGVMRNLGRLEAMELQLQKVEAEFKEQEKKIDDQSQMIQTLIRQNVILLQLAGKTIDPNDLNKLFSDLDYNKLLRNGGA